MVCPSGVVHLKVLEEEEVEQEDVAPLRHAAATTSLKAELMLMAGFPEVWMAEGKPEPSFPDARTLGERKKISLTALPRSSYALTARLRPIDLRGPVDRGRRGRRPEERPGAPGGTGNRRAL